MKFIIEPLNETDCRIVEIDFSGLQGRALDELVIPATVEQDGKTYLVKEVGPKVCFTNKFDDNSARYASLRKVKKIVFSEGIEVIEGSIDCDGTNADERGIGETLTEVTLPTTLKVIGKNSFRCCRILSAINIPDSVEEIGAEAFERCSSLPYFQWPKSLKRIGKYAFYKMKTAPDSSETNDSSENNDVILEVDIPDFIEKIENPYENSSWFCKVKLKCRISAKAFPVLDDSEMTEIISEIDIPEGVTKVTGHYKGLSNVTLPSTLEEIGEKVFSDSSVLNCIDEFPSSLKSIGKKAFSYARGYNSNGRKEIRISSSEIRVGEDAFDANGELRIIGSEDVMSNLMRQPGALNGTLIEEINIPEGTTEVYIAHCKELRRVCIPSTVTEIREISYCPKLEELIVPDSVIKIGKISDCGIKKIRLSENLDQLGILANCENLKELSLPDSLNKLKDDSSEWSGLYGLIAVINASTNVWKIICSNKYALENYKPITGRLTIPEGVENLAEGLLKRTEIPLLNLPSTLRTIGRECLKESKGLKTLTIPAGVEVIPSWMAWQSSDLESIQFAVGSQLKAIEYGAFAKTALKNVILPDGLTKISGEVFMDIPSLETITFPASMVEYGSKDRWGAYMTPVVRCKNLKYVVFLADDPGKAVYPLALGKLCDWYVPDHMVDHVKAYMEKAKKENPSVKGVGAKSVKPLSKLSGATAAPRKKTAAPKKQQLTQAIRMETIGLDAIYRFPVAESDLPMLENTLDRAILAVRYLREKTAECSFTIEDNRPRGSWVTEELSLETNVNSATDDRWHATGKSTLTLDFADTTKFPEDFPIAKAAELAEAGGFKKLFAAKCSNYMSALPEEAPAYLEVKFNITIKFDFKVGEKEKFNVKKITVIDDWCITDDWRITWKDSSCWRFALMYNGRYIPASEVEVLYPNMNIKASPKPDMKKEIEAVSTEIDGVSFDYFEFKTSGSLPFINDMLTLSK